MKKTTTLLCLTLVAAFLMGGCSNNPSGTDKTSGLNLTDEFGGYTASAEEVAFGDSELLAEAAATEGQEFDDAILLSPGVDSVIVDSTYERYRLRILWGQLRCDSTVGAVTDWSGSLTVSNGVEVIKRVIHFELGQDYIPTRTDRSLIEWVSYTTIHNDGIAVDVYVPTDASVDPITVTFATGPYTREFSIDELMALDTIVYLDDADSNAVAFHAFRATHTYCPRGFLAGHWGFDEDGNGVFRGMWLSRAGFVEGYIDGHYGLDDDDRPVFFGKWITADGECEGLLRGTYGPNPNWHANDIARRRAGGWFAGSIFDANATEIGTLKGKYRSHPVFRSGFFTGRWKVYCNQEVSGLTDIDEGF